MRHVKLPQGAVKRMSVSVLVVLFNLVADVAYAYLDPRIRLG